MVCANSRIRFWHTSGLISQKPREKRKPEISGEEISGLQLGAIKGYRSTPIHGECLEFDWQEHRYHPRHRMNLY